MTTRVKRNLKRSGHVCRCCRCGPANPLPPAPYTDETWRRTASVYVDAHLLGSPESRERAHEAVAEADWTACDPFDFVETWKELNRE